MNENLPPESADVPSPQIPASGYVLHGVLPRKVPRELQWHLCFSVFTLGGALFFGISSAFAIALGSRTALPSALLLHLSHRDVPGQIDRSWKTNYKENDNAVYGYDFSFELPNGARKHGASYSVGTTMAPQSPQLELDPASAVVVEYVPFLPSISRIQGTRVGLCSPFVFFTVILAFIGALVIYRSIKSGRRRVHLLQHGRLARVEMVSARIIETSKEQDWEPPIGKREPLNPRDQPPKSLGSSAGTEGTGVEGLRKYQLEQRNLTGRPRAFVPGFVVFVGLFVSVWAGLATTFLLGWFFEPDMSASRFFGWPLLFAALVFALLVRWVRRHNRAAAKGLRTAPATNVECTYRFDLSDGTRVTASDRLPLPESPQDSAAQTVLFHPDYPERAQRLSGFSPPLRLTPNHEWEFFVDGWWRWRLAAAVLLCIAGLVLGLLIDPVGR